MSGIDYLLDTNYVLALLKQRGADALNERSLDVLLDRCGVSAITVIELLSYPNLTEPEAERIREFLAQVTRVPIAADIEVEAIRIRRLRRLKVPDAIILATAKVRGVKLLTMDQQLQSALESV